MEAFERRLEGFLADFDGVPLPRRAMALLVAALAFCDAFKLINSQSAEAVTEDEFVSIARQAYQRLRGFKGRN